MKRIVFAACVLSLALACAGNAQSTASSLETRAHYSKSELKKMKRAANSPTQYEALATYFSEQHSTYSQKAAEAKKEWERRSLNVTSAAAKYPRPVDTARYIYEYYLQKASEAGTLEAKFSHLASPDTLANAQ